MTALTELVVREEQARVVQSDALAALRKVTGLPASAAVARLRYGPGRTCEPVARILDRALAKAGVAGIRPDQLVVAGGCARRAEDIVRVRRKAHGKADWISSETSDIEIRLEPAGLRASAHTAGAAAEPPGISPHDSPARSEPAAAVPDARSQRVRDALYDVLDPDLGVNVVDLGFVRDIAVEQGTAVITMTLTSPACPLTGVMEDQIRTALADGAGYGVNDHRVAWVWQPAWRPSDITSEGRDQLRAIGFNNF
uniref:iron-sulfur cluster assembly protein n=1 Tax=Streptomyces silvisoli TaxID=3034235 RepID=UPI0028BF23C9|nr:iron-sulfur cluster assembly protein [Streptomyces silvisoli]